MGSIIYSSVNINLTCIGVGEECDHKRVGLGSGLDWWNCSVSRLWWWLWKYAIFKEHGKILKQVVCRLHFDQHYSHSSFSCHCLCQIQMPLPNPQTLHNQVHPTFHMHLPSCWRTCTADSHWTHWSVPSLSLCPCLPPPLQCPSFFFLTHQILLISSFPNPYLTSTVNFLKGVQINLCLFLFLNHILLFLFS